MKRIFLRLAFPSALFVAAMTLPVHSTASTCTQMLPFGGVTSLDNCINICAAHHCGFNRYDPSTHYCYCGDKV